MSTGADVPAGSPPFDGGRAWLEAAIGGGLPDPVRTRWQPLRVGIVDLWEYDQEEFWAADGRLVLRGGNGAGKTKVLELTTLMLLRGEIGASVLDPFGSQHRTMRFNLLPTGEADDPRPPADSGLGYAWAEFGRLDESGQARFLVVGMGVSARRGSGTTPVTTWQFVTQLRPGKDLVLRGGGRAIDHKDLRRLDGVWVAPSAAAYRMRIADELFGLTPGAFDNLTDLLKQLRRPKLGERLNPTTLAETLRDALPALAEHELTQLADGWDRLDRLRVAVEKTEQAARVVATFVRTGWRPWARLVVRREADAMAAATTDLDRTTRDKRAAEQERDRAKEAVRGAEEALTATRAEHHDRAVELRELLDSTPYQDAVSAAGRVESLREQLTLATERLGRAQTAHTEWAGRLVAAAEECDTADAARQRADARVTATANTVRSAGAAAGLPEAVDRHLPERDHEGLGAALAVRRERFAHLASLHDAHGEAGRQVDRSAAIVEDRQVDFRGAQDDETATRSAVGRFAAELDTAVRAWAAIATLVPVSAAASTGGAASYPAWLSSTRRAGTSIPARRSSGPYASTSPPATGPSRRPTGPPGSIGRRWRAASRRWARSWNGPARRSTNPHRSRRPGDGGPGRSSTRGQARHCGGWSTRPRESTDGSSPDWRPRSRRPGCSTSGSHRTAGPATATGSS
jgi:hypothetical protein